MFDPMLHPYPEQVVYRYRQYLHDADQARLAKLAGAQHPQLFARFALWLSDRLIITGLSLKCRYRPRHEASW